MKGKDRRYFTKSATESASCRINTNNKGVHIESERVATMIESCE